MVSGTIVAPISSLQLAPGSRVTIDNVSWDDYGFLLLEMGDRSCDRMIYSADLGSMTMNMVPGAGGKLCASHSRDDRIKLY